MEERGEINLPLVGQIQHGEQQIINNKTRVVELRSFYCENQK